MPIQLLAMSVPDPAQAPTELTLQEQQDAFVALGNAVSTLDTYRRTLNKLLQADDMRQQARRILDNLDADQVQALRLELAVPAQDMVLVSARLPVTP